MEERLGELLLRENIITAEQLKRASEEQSKEGGRLGNWLIKLGMIDEKDLLNFLSRQYQVPSIDLDDFEIDQEVVNLLTEDVANKHLVIPVHRAGASLVAAMVDPSNIFAIDDIKFLTGYNVDVVVASEEQIRRAIEKYYQATDETSYDDVMSGFDEDEIEWDSEDDALNVVDLEKSAEEAPVVRLVNLMLIDAIKKAASDIHIEPYEKEFRIRYRIDGQLYEVMRPPLKLRNAVISRIKIMSSLDIAERRLPQDGRIKLKLGKGREMDFRVSLCPTLYGEKCVLRLLDKSQVGLDMNNLGIDEEPLDDFLGGIHRPYGMVLVTGPTGSGKTTTLYSALSDLNKTTENISTAEDPVEFNLAGINQVQMHEEIGLNFASALRSFLRQDPDIIMVGEIRDFETAEVSIKAALTGHLVLSTVHTNDAPSTVSRLLNMGIEPFLISAVLNTVIAQRLLRVLCDDCKKPIELPGQTLRDLQVPEDRIGKFEPMRGAGCATCSKTGYKGRVGIFEVMNIGENVKDLILNGGSTAELKTEAVRQGMKTLRQSALEKFMEGTTSMEEVGRVSMAD
ncbi:MAG: type IV-A pilus assembly ATPase PilB [Myxococcota bacterium]|jgi:type IV pilus assembly protein PilB|nr:type IV-A pilus assembly ATPase PilB [Myxococcota bacterium]